MVFGAGRRGAHAPDHARCVAGHSCGLWRFLWGDVPSASCWHLASGGGGALVLSVLGWCVCVRDAAYGGALPAHSTTGVARGARCDEPFIVSAAGQRSLRHYFPVQCGFWLRHGAGGGDVCPCWGWCCLLSPSASCWRWRFPIGCGCSLPTRCNASRRCWCWLAFFWCR